MNRSKTSYISFEPFLKEWYFTNFSKLFPKFFYLSNMFSNTVNLNQTTVDKVRNPKI